MKSRSARLLPMVAILLLQSSPASSTTAGWAPTIAFINPMKRKTKEQRATSDRSHPGTAPPPLDVDAASTLRKNEELLQQSAASDGRSAGNPWTTDSVQECAELWGLSPNDQVHLYELATRLVDVRHADFNQPCQVARFLQEFKDVDKAETKFRQMIDWRQANNVDQLLLNGNYQPPPLYRYFPAAVLEGVDRDGDPIHVERTGAADSAGLLRRYGRDEMITHATWLREVQTRGAWHADYERVQGHPVKQFTIILDMKGLSRKNMSPQLISVGQHVGRLVQDYYPGYTKRIVVVNAPTVFQIAYSLFKPLMDENMKKRVVIASSSTESQRLLEKYVDPVNLPAVLHPLGRGKAVSEFDTVWEGGILPSEAEEAARVRAARTQQQQPNQKRQQPEPPPATTPSQRLRRMATETNTHAVGAMAAKSLRAVGRMMQRQGEQFTQLFA